jgi:membrane protein YdbS with pleckstrin-like domain
MNNSPTTGSDDQQVLAADGAGDPQPVRPVDRTELSETGGFEQLDPHWVGLTRVERGIVWAVVGVLVLTTGIGLICVVPFPWMLLVPIVWIALAGLFTLSAIFWPRWEYQRWSYRVDCDVLELRFGVLWHTSVAIPLSRLQHVDLHRGPLESRWGLASIQIHTAGTREASHTIPGLDLAVANEFRDRLIDAASRRPHEQDSH